MYINNGVHKVMISTNFCLCSSTVPPVLHQCAEDEVTCLKTHNHHITHHKCYTVLPSWDRWTEMEWVTKGATTVHLMSAGEVMYDMSEQMIIILMDLWHTQLRARKADAADAVTQDGVELATLSLVQRHWIYWLMEEHHRVCECYRRVCIRLCLCVRWAVKYYFKVFSHVLVYRYLLF